MGLAASVLWGLSMREFLALRRQFEDNRKFQLGMVAAIRADIHNTAGKSFKEHFDAQRFMPGGKDDSIEARARELMAQGVAPAAAVAMASSKQSKESQIHIVKSAMAAADARAKKGKRSRRAG